MTDPYWHHSSRSAERSSAPRPTHPVDLPFDLPPVASQPSYYSRHLSSTEHLNRESHAPQFRAHLYGLDDYYDAGVRVEPAVNGLAAEIDARAYNSNYSSTFEDPNIPRSRRDISRGIDVAIPEPLPDRQNSLRTSDALDDDAKETSSMLFVDGLPVDCTRREVGHIFRPFIGFKDIRVVHKEPRLRGDKAKVMCFVEFDNPSCARTAKEALHGYKFDDKKPDSSVLNIHFAHFPFKIPSSQGI